MENYLKELRPKTLIFSLSTGRSGTKLLSTLLGYFPEIQSEHESQPAFHDYLSQVIDGSLSPKDFWFEKKLPYISKFPKKVYSDVSHVMCKGFLDSLLDFDLNLFFIILQRDKREVALSLYRLNTIPARSELGRKYLISPSDSPFLKMGQYENLSDYQLCFWYTLEFERRVAHYRRIFEVRNIPFLEISFEELTSGSALKTIKDELSLRNPPLVNRVRYWKNRNKKINRKEFHARSLKEIDFDREENELLTIIS